MIPWTITYEDPTAAPMGQESKNRILGLLNQWWDNTMENISLLIIITPKDNTQALRKAENKHSKSRDTGSEGHLSALYIIIEVYPPPLLGHVLSVLTPMISNLFLLPPMLTPPPSLGLVPWALLSLPPPPPLLRVRKKGGQLRHEW